MGRSDTWTLDDWTKIVEKLDVEGEKLDYIEKSWTFSWTKIYFLVCKSRAIKGNKQDDMDDVDELDQVDEKM